jgi:hypothetical protein
MAFKCHMLTKLKYQGGIYITLVSSYSIILIILTDHLLFALKIIFTYIKTF